MFETADQSIQTGTLKEARSWAMLKPCKSKFDSIFFENNDFFNSYLQTQTMN